MLIGLRYLNGFSVSFLLRKKSKRNVNFMFSKLRHFIMDLFLKLFFIDVVAKCFIINWTQTDKLRELKLTKLK